MLPRILTSAVFAGAVAGLIAGLLQLVFVQPVLLHAELYESGELVHFATSVMVDGAAHDHASHDHVTPATLMRNGLTVVFSMLLYSGYALILLSVMSQAEARGASITPRTGLIWGAAGFVAIFLAPAFSLAPEVPGVASIDIAQRQVWWLGTVVSTAIALWLIAFHRGWMFWGIAVALLLAPHLIGAPQAEEFAGPVPTELASLFTSRALGTSMASWTILGCLAGFMWARGSDPHRTAV